jgi:hypothetical protein
VDYTYYEGTYSGTDAYGNFGDLKTVKVTDGSGKILNMEYYRYYTPNDSDGYVGGLKYVFDFASYSRLLAVLDGVSASLTSDTAFTTADPAVADYAVHYFQYGDYHRVIEHDVQGSGGTSTNGIGIFTYSYSTNALFDFTDDSSNRYNTWEYETTETLPDHNTNTVYCNALGRMLLKDFDDEHEDDPSSLLVGQHWYTYYEYNHDGQVTLEAGPSAITGTPTVGTTTISVSLTGPGPVYLTTYYSTTSASGAIAGGVQGFVRYRDIQTTSGTSRLESINYYLDTSGGSLDSPGSSYAVVATDTVYRSAGGTDPETTTYVPAWSSVDGVTQPLSVTAALPVVSFSENGSNSPDSDDRLPAGRGLHDPPLRRGAVGRGLAISAGKPQNRAPRPRADHLHRAPGPRGLASLLAPRCACLLLPAGRK